ncbi:MAG: hypothetical protein P8172_07305 [Gammaproteobacteria bacterium]
MTRSPVQPTLHFGVAVPQANPTVEAEFRHLLRDRFLPVMTRLTSQAPDPGERLKDYFEQIGTAIASFDTLALAAFGFACTGSGYLVGVEAEDAAVQRLMDHFGLPVVTATGAIRAELAILGARRLAIFAPYPEALCAAAEAYWDQAGFRVVTLQRLQTGSDDTRSIYALTPDVVALALQRFASGDVDVVLLSGTGMPTLEALTAHGGCPPMISSNLCLATQMLRRTGEWPSTAPADVEAMLAGAD